MTVANLLIEYKLAIRNSSEDSSDCYTALNSVKDEAVNKIIAHLGISALSGTPSEHTVTLTTAYKYSVSTASPTIGYIVEVNTNNYLGTEYREAKRIESPWYYGMPQNPRYPSYRMYGGQFELRGQPEAGKSAIIIYLGEIADLSSATTVESGLIDEADRMWAWYAAARHFENTWEDTEASRCYKVFNQKLFGTQKGF